MKNRNSGQKKKINTRGLIFVISGPSGSGKTTLAEQILKDKTLSRKVRKSISFTTRPKRSGEKDKRDYFFINQASFEKALKAKKILESTSYLGYHYGTPKASVDSQISKGRHLVLCVDLRGARNLKRLYPKNTATVFVMPPSLEELRRRIQNRCCKTGAKELKQRLELAKKEILQADKFDYCLVNKDLNKSVRLLRCIILNRINQ